MVKFYCDKCGAEISPVPRNQRYGKYFRIKIVSNNFYDSNDQTTTVHLCDDCQEQLEKFIFSKIEHAALYGDNSES